MTTEIAVMESELSSTLSSKGIAILQPNTEAFTNATLRWSTYKAPNYAAAVVPTSEQEVAEVVKCARAARTPFLATGGRHGYGTTLGHLTKGLAIDLSHMKSVSVDQSAETVTVGPGNKISEVIGAVQEVGYELPTGSCPCVGVIGATVGGGVGVYQGLLGLMIDSLVSVRLVTAQGDIVEASATANSDLFWGIRGAGSNFGIITSATYKLHKAVNNAQVFIADTIYPASLVGAYFDVLGTFQDTMPAELSIASFVIWDATTNGTQLIGTFIYSGTESQARKVLAPFFDLNPPVVQANNVAYSQVPTTLAFGSQVQTCVPGSIRDIFGVNVRKLPSKVFVTAFNKFDAFFKANPDARASAAVFETFSNKAVASVPDEDTAYPWRDSKGNFMFQMSWPNLGNPVEGAVNSFAREIRQDFISASGYPDLAVYVSYAHGDETLEQVYGKDKLPRLTELKNKWDPDNVFAYNFALPTEYP